MSIVLRTKIKFWFEYLRLAHKSSDPRVISALRSNKDKYQRWGDYQNIPFDKWWKDHSTLFKETSTTKVRKYVEGEVVEADGFCLQVPLSYAPSTASKIFKEMYSRELEKIGVSLKNKRSSHRVSFSLSIHDLKVDRFRHYLFYTKNVYLPLLSTGNKVQTIKFIHKAVSVFAKVKRLKSSGKESKVPFQTTVKDDYNNLSRMARRYNSYSKNILLNVANGEFPGKY
jgi:hypothetical protein